MLIAERITKAQRMPIATLSSVCHESRNEVILKYPDLLPLHIGNFMRFSSSKDVVMLTTTKITRDSEILPGFRLIKPPIMDTAIHFPFEWNTQVQNIAFKQVNALELAEIPVRHPEIIEAFVMIMKPNFNFLNLFPRLKNYFSKHTVLCASKTLKALRREWGVSIQTYVEQEFASPEHIPSPGDSTKAFPTWHEFTDEDATTFLSDRKNWSAAVHNVLDDMMHANTQDDTENQARVTRLRGINYSTMVGFWEYD